MGAPAGFERRGRTSTIAIQVAAAFALACGGDATTDPGNPDPPGHGLPPGGQTPPPADALVITTAALPSATVDLSYTVSLEASGGTPPYQWTVVAGELPTGLALDREGDLAGTPGFPAGLHPFTVRVEDADGETASANLSLQLVAPSGLQVTTVALRVGDANQPYADTLSAEGGAPPYTFEWAGFGGLTLEAETGAVSGTPGHATGADGEPTEVLVTVRDAVGASAIAQVEFGVRPAPLVITLDIPDGRIGQGYHYYFTWEGGLGDPITWSVISGALPPGLSIGTSQLYGTYLGGTANTIGTFEFTLQAVSGDFTAARDYTVVISDLELLIVTSTLPNADVGTPYSVFLVREGGTGPFTWHVVSGSPPAGISLTAAGELTGTPTEAGEASFEVRVRDAGGQSATASLVLEVQP